MGLLVENNFFFSNEYLNTVAIFLTSNIIKLVGYFRKKPNHCCFTLYLLGGRRVIYTNTLSISPKINVMHQLHFLTCIRIEIRANWSKGLRLMQIKLEHKFQLELITNKTFFTQCATNITDKLLQVKTQSLKNCFNQNTV